MCTSSHYFGVFKKKIRQKYARGGSCSRKQRNARSAYTTYYILQIASAISPPPPPPTRSLLLLRMMYGRTPEPCNNEPETKCASTRAHSCETNAFLCPPPPSYFLIALPRCISRRSHHAKTFRRKYRIRQAVNQCVLFVTYIFLVLEF